MTIELKIPSVGESIQEVQISQWLKHEGDRVAADEDLVSLETDKATMELPAPADGVIRQILKQDGETAAVGETIAYLDEAERAPAQPPAKADQTEKQQSPPSKSASPNDKPNAKSTTMGNRRRGRMAAKSVMNRFHGELPPQLTNVWKKWCR